MELTSIEALQLAISILGSQSATADAIGIRQQSVSDMVRSGKRVPAEWCIPLERATEAKGKIVTRYQLRPDLYPLDDDTQQPTASHAGAVA